MANDIQDGRASGPADGDRHAAVRDHLASDGPYEIRHGDVWLKGEGRHIADGSGRMAVARDGDMIMKHGEATRVAAYAKTAQDRYAAAGLGPSDPDTPRIEVIDFPITPQTIAELNACVACTGRVAKLEENLGRVTDHSPADEYARTHGDPMNPYKAWVTREDLAGALELIDGASEGTGEMSMCLATIAPAVRQPVFTPEGEPVPGRVERGVQGIAALERGFGTRSATRGLHIDAAHAGSLPGGPESMAAIKAVSAGRGAAAEAAKAAPPPSRGAARPSRRSPAGAQR